MIIVRCCGMQPGARVVPVDQRQQSSWQVWQSVANTSSGEPTQQPSPRHASAPSLTATAVISRPTTVSSHQAPAIALPARPVRSAPARWAEHVLAALALGRGRSDLLRDALFGDAEQRHGDQAPDRERHPGRADVGVLAAGECAHGLERDVRSEQEELDGNELWARCSAVCDITREPVKRQMMITLAKP
jgi:hypothetical protein